MSESEEYLKSIGVSNVIYDMNNMKNPNIGLDKILNAYAKEQFKKQLSALIESYDDEKLKKVFMNNHSEFMIGKTHKTTFATNQRMDLQDFKKAVKAIFKERLNKQ